MSNVEHNPTVEAIEDYRLTRALIRHLTVVIDHVREQRKGVTRLEEQRSRLLLELTGMG